MEPAATAIIKTYDQLKGERAVLENHWQEIAERILPRYSGTFFGREPDGSKRTDKMIDATGAKALEAFAAVVKYFVTPDNQTWHRLRHPDPSLMRRKTVQDWYEDTTRRLFSYRYAAKSGYQSTQHESYISLGAFGTGTYLVEPPNSSERLGTRPAPKGLRYRSLPINGIYFRRNYAGVIDESYRCIRLSAAQAAQQFGRDKLPKVVEKELEKAEKNAAYTGAHDEKFEFIHAVRPNRNFDGEKIDARGMAWSSVYVCREGSTIVKEGGYTTWPFPVNRYLTAPGELYGRSPAMLALPALKTINAEKEIVLKQGQRAVDPVLLAFDDGVIDSFDLRPGAINPGGVDSMGRKLVQRLDDGVGISVGLDLMELERKDINDIFLVSIFMHLQENPQMTATEVLERTREKGALVSPTVGRQQVDALAPMIERELDLMADQGLLSDPPPELVEAGGVDYEIEYESPLARAQKAEEAAGFLRTLEIAGNVAAITQDPSHLDIFDLDAALPELNWINAGPSRWIRSPEVIEQIRAGRAQQAQMQTMIEAAPAAAGVMKAVQGMPSK